MAELQGKRVIVTGAASGIGLETATRMSAEGASVVVADIAQDKLDGAAEQVRGAGGQASPFRADISDESDVKALVAHAIETFGGLDVVVNNAALLNVPGDTDLLSQEVEAWDASFAVNARGTMLMCKHAVIAMRDGGGGAIVNISSGTTVAGDFFSTAYACTKAAINTLTKYVATQYGAAGVRCNAIAPGLIRTPALASAMPEPMQAMFAEHKPVGRLGEPADIAQAAIFLSSDRAAFITGQVLPVDGGFFAHLPSTVDVGRAMLEVNR